MEANQREEIKRKEKGTLYEFTRKLERVCIFTGEKPESNGFVLGGLF
jgi:hypothetical protein